MRSSCPAAARSGSTWPRAFAGIFTSERSDFETRVAKVPIVPGAIIFDLGVGGQPDIWPTAECGYRSRSAPPRRDVAEGNVGAGAGATVGKSGGGGGPMKGGLGTASIAVRVAGADSIVAAIVAVNAVGDVIDPGTGAVVAGVRRRMAKGWPMRASCLQAGRPAPAHAGENTTIGVVATNARLTKVQATKVAQMAHDGLARAIYPAHTMGDGDTIFALATGGIEQQRRVAHRRAGGRGDGGSHRACRARGDGPSRLSRGTEI